MSDPQWVTQRQAAALLGVHPSLIPKMLRRGDLKSRVQAPSLSHSEVLSLAEARAAETAKLEARRARRAAKASGPRPPDEEHEWLLAPSAAAVLGCTEIALGGRAARGQVPYVVHGGRRWFRLDQIELQVRSEVAQRTRRP
ncbi:hypothetical protein [Nocardioides furvisabuli]|uniref:hypothetical protein n=1 Tax=Nocardioides furvisabuli TaxID=375542 RepID=UPI001E3AD3C4|nr:hypothetical protein [Nocardioides furvisabuli]